MIRNLSIWAVILCCVVACTPATDETNTENTTEEVMQKAQPAKDYAIVIHGGAGTIRRENMTQEMDSMYRSALDSALTIGENILKSGGSSADAVTKTIMFMEDSPLFNAGKGAVFTNEGKNELDAAFMDGKTLNAGAIAGVTNIKNPITAARAVMEQSEHVMLIGEGAEEFAQEKGLELVNPLYFYTERRWEAIQRIIQREQEETGDMGLPNNHKYGTVGCVAMDQEGNIVAGTSTGGMTNKRYGRVGDVPIIGAGTYANNNTCGVSATGHGEYFIRYTVAHDISAIMEYKGASLQEAADEVVMKKLVEAKGSGGIIAIDKNGEVSMTFNSEGMYRGYARPGKRVVQIYKDETEEKEVQAQDTLKAKEKEKGQKASQATEEKPAAAKDTMQKMQEQEAKQKLEKAEER